MTKLELERLLETFSIKGEVKVRKKTKVRSRFKPIQLEIKKISKYEGCYNTNNEVMAVILNKKLYVLPKGIIKEYLLLTSGLKCKSFVVPLSECIYEFEKEIDYERWQHLMCIKENIMASW